MPCRMFPPANLALASSWPVAKVWPAAVTLTHLQRERGGAGGLEGKKARRLNGDKARNR